MSMNLQSLYLVLPLLLCVAVFWWAPLWSRRGLFFSVTVPGSFRDSPEGRAVLSRYRRGLLVLSLLALGAFVGVMATSTSLWAWQVPYLFYLVGACVLFSRIRGEVMPFQVAPSGRREASLVPRSASLPGGWLGQLGPLLVLAAGAVALARRWADIPNRVPIHWGLNGQPDAWAERSAASVFSLLCFGAVLCLVLWMTNLTIIKSVRRVSASAAEEERHRSTSLAITTSSYTLAIVFVALSFLPLLGQGEALPMAIWFIVLAFPILCLALVIFLHQRKLRALEALPEAAQHLGDGTEDRHWKAGLFYYNPEDPAVVIEKRFGIGYTLNFAKGKAWMFLGATLIAPVTIVLLLLLLK